MPLVGSWVSYSSGHYNNIIDLGLNERHLFLTVSEARKSKIKVPADSVSGENPLPGLQMAIFSLCPQMAEREKDRNIKSSSKGTDSITWAPLSRPMHIPKSPLPKSITLGIKDLTYDFWGGHRYSVYDRQWEPS